jgi:hypothetical protein
VPAAPPLLGSTGSTTLALAGALVIIGIAMICTAVWLVRSTRTDLPVLGPLEVMGDRRFRRSDPDARKRDLAAARPPGAPAPAPMLEADAVVAELPPAPIAGGREPAVSVADDAPEPAPSAGAGEPVAVADADERVADTDGPVAVVEEPQPAESA